MSLNLELTWGFYRHNSPSLDQPQYLNLSLKERRNGDNMNNQMPKFLVSLWLSIIICATNTRPLVARPLVVGRWQVDDGWSVESSSSLLLLPHLLLFHAGTGTDAPDKYLRVDYHPRVIILATSSVFSGSGSGIASIRAFHRRPRSLDNWNGSASEFVPPTQKEGRKDWLLCQFSNGWNSSI